MKLLESDLKILRSLLDHGQMTTRQISLGVGRSDSSVRRRMRQLDSNGFAVDLGRERVCDLKLYALGPRGLEAMAEERQVPVALLPVSTKPPAGYLSVLEPHRRLVTDIRIAAHHWARLPSCPIRISCSRHEGHLSSNPQRRASKSRWEQFLLGWNLPDPLDPTERLGCIPDAMFVLCPRDHLDQQMSCFIEADRGTEQIENGPIWAKFRGYLAVWLSGAFRQVSERPDLSPTGMRVLFVLAKRSRWRIKAMRLALLKFLDYASKHVGDTRFRDETFLRQFANVFRFALAPELLAPETDFFQTPVWETVGKSREGSTQRSKVPLFRGAPQSGLKSVEEPTTSGSTAIFACTNDRREGEMARNTATSTHSQMECTP